MDSCRSITQNSVSVKQTPVVVASGLVVAIAKVERLSEVVIDLKIGDLV